MSLESNKIECMLSINSFNKPAEKSGKAAWVQLILNLMFLKKGTYPSMPTMGIGIQFYEYEFIDDLKVILEEEIGDQIRTFLPDIPFRSIGLSTSEHEGKTILIITIILYNQAGPETVVVAATTSQNNIDFEVVF